MSEVVQFSLEFAVIGIAIVFVSLAIIALVVALVRRLDEGWKKGEKDKAAAAVDKDQSIDTTTLVLISAAVATMFQGRAHIRRVRRLMPRDAQRGTWSVQGRAMLHGSHVVPKKR
jgi:Na+-transporting methylmalonyl-CoA/oxaloacetate decarboxylase gamma subunit